ncbi:MAG: AAA family ATPase [Bacteroidales bacterium]|nr:AAA family ATPase [Bacteroidales bacterium]
MITRLEINGFKTFVDFVMEFTPFTVIAGANASGKSNIFDALKLLANLSSMDVRSAFENLRGEAEEQFSQLEAEQYSKEINLAVEFLVDRKIKDNWGEEATLKYTRLRYEIIIQREKNDSGFEDLKISHEKLVALKHQEDNWIKNNILNSEEREFWRPKVKSGKRGNPYIFTEEVAGKENVRIPLDGKPGPGKEYAIRNISQSALSSVNSVEFPHVFAAKCEMQSWRFLQLNPEDLRKPSPRLAPNTISHSGANLASTLFRLKTRDKFILNDISIELNNILPNFIGIDVKEEINENRFVIKLKSDDGKVFSSRVLSEGTLRLLILCILKYDDFHKGVICFEEPENGIHPFRIEMMIQLLFGLSTQYSDFSHPLRQIIVNTHSSAFVGKILNRPHREREISVWFSVLLTKFQSKNHLKSKATKVIPVRNSYGQSRINFIEDSEIEITEIEVKKYLESTDFGS